MQLTPNSDAVSVFDTHAPSSNTEATKTIAAAAGDIWVTDFVTASYEGGTGGTTGLLKVTIGGTIKWQVDMEGADKTYHFTFPRGLMGGKNEAVVYSLAAAGSGITGKLSFSYH